MYGCLVRYKRSNSVGSGYFKVKSGKSHLIDYALKSSTVWFCTEKATSPPCTTMGYVCDTSEPRQPWRLLRVAFVIEENADVDWGFLIAIASFLCCTGSSVYSILAKVQVEVPRILGDLHQVDRKSSPEYWFF